MALATFDRPVYAQHKHFVQEITGLDDVFDFLDEWPQEKRNLAYEVMMDACRKAANRELPVSVVSENFRRFLKQNGMLAQIDTMPKPLRQGNDRNVSGR